MKIILIPLIIAAIGISTAWADNEAIFQKAQDAAKLLKIVRDEGTVGVIIKLDVPNIDKLTAASKCF
jgi:hypothetical protein